MIGIFDSGLGGIQTLQEIKTLLPDYDYIFLADNIHAPYGEQSPQHIKKYTFTSLQRLFDQGCHLVIIACNTAAAYAIKPRQAQYPEHKALSVTIPGIKTIIESGYQSLAIMATLATITSDIYYDVLTRHGFNGTIQYISAGDLVRAIENPQSISTTIDTILQDHITSINNVDALVLGCTHFPIVGEQIRQYRSKPIIDPGYNAATQLIHYLHKHGDIKTQLTTHGTTKYYTTGSATTFAHKLQHTFGQSYTVTTVIL